MKNYLRNNCDNLPPLIMKVAKVLFARDEQKERSMAKEASTSSHEVHRL